MKKLLKWLGTKLRIVSMSSTTSVEIDGAMIPASALIPLLNQLAQNAAPGPGDFSLTECVAGTALTARNIIQGLVRHLTTAGTDTLPLAADIIAQLPGVSAASKVGRTFMLKVINASTPNAVTLATNTGLTLVGTLATSALQARLYLGSVTSTTQVTLTEIMGNTITA